MRGFALMFALCLAAPAAADTLIAARTIRAKEVLAASDLALRPGTTPGALEAPAQAVGQEARVALYAGRPVRQADLGPPALVERNQIVTVIYASGGLWLSAEARALARGAAGERIRVMNLASRTSLFGAVRDDGTVLVSP